MIERATLDATTSPRAAVALKHAPQWVRDLAAGRAAGRAAGVAAAGRKPPAVAAGAAAAKRHAGVIVGAVAPFVSHPVETPRDPQRIGEQVARSAWAGVLADLRADPMRNAVILKTAHQRGGLLAMTTNGTLELFEDERVGLMFAARLPDDWQSRAIIADANERGTGVACSMGFCREQTRHDRRSNGQTVRVLERFLLRDLSLVREADRRAAYPGARCFGSTQTDAATVRSLRDKAATWATRYGVGNVRTLATDPPLRRRAACAPPCPQSCPPAPVWPSAVWPRNCCGHDGG